MIVKLILLVISVISVVSSDNCIVQNECHCFVGSDITCNASLTDSSLKNLFQTVKEEHRLGTLTILNNNFTKIANNAFGKVSFEKYYLHHNPNLTTIEEDAFSGSENRTSTVYLHSCSLKGNSVFKAISKLIYLTEIYLDDNQLEEIPDHAFGQQHYLKTVALSRNKIKVLGRMAFYSLVSIDFIDLENNLIKQIDSDAFSFENMNHTAGSPLKISLRINQIVNISESAFRGLKRPVDLDLSFNNVTEFNKTPFEDILSRLSSKIIAKGNPIDCGCPIKWIFDNNDYKHKLSGPIRCADKKYFSSLTKDHFKNCTSY